MNEEKRLSEIFNDDPECGWDGHNCVILWNLFRGMLHFAPCATADEFETEFRKCYKKVFGKELRASKDDSWDNTDNRTGMSFSARPNWWIEKVLPILRERFEHKVAS